MSVTFSIEKEKDGPEFNISNRNCSLLFDYLNIDDKNLVGHISKQDFPVIIRRLIKLLNSKKERSSLYIKPERNGIFFDFGVDDETVCYWVKSLMKLIKEAEKLDRKIIYV